MRYVILLSLLTACPAPNDTVFVDYTGTDTGSGTDVGTDSNGNYLLPQYHCGEVRADQAWGPDRSMHVVECAVTVVQGATLSILPGTKVVFGPAGSISVADDATPSSFGAHGTAEAPVTFGQAVVGSPWAGFSFGERAVDIGFSYATISGAGGDATIASNATLHADHLTIQDGLSAGVVLTGAGFDDSSTALTITGLASKPVELDASFADTLPATDSAYTGNATDWIDVRGDTLTESATWANLGVPYVLRGDVNVDGFAARPAVLTIDAGTTFLVGDGVSITVGTAGDAGLVVDGTTAAPVRFTAFGAAMGGYWGGLSLGRYTLPEYASVQHALLEWGGGNGAALSATDVDVLVNDVTLRSSVDAGFRLAGAAAFQTGSRDLTSTGSRVPGTVSATSVASIPTATTVLTGNTLDMLEIDAATPIVESTTWPLLDVPYWVLGTVNVRGWAEAPAVLTLSPGSTLYFGFNAGLNVSTPSGAGGLLALGTPSAPIVLTAGMANEHGAWRGLAFGDHCDEAQTRLTNTTIAWAGAPSNEAALFLDRCNPAQLDDLTIFGSWGFGVRALDEWPANLNNLVGTNNALGSMTCEGDTCWCTNNAWDPKTESDVDCGGVCGGCETGLDCAANTDCFSGVCTLDVCE